VIKLYVDGGTRNNSICLVDGFKTIIKIRNGKTGKPTNNELEYFALLYALTYISNKYSKRNVKILSDSMLVVKQINKVWRITTPTLTPIWEKCMKLMTDKIKVGWVSREFNRAGWVLEK
jgi:ribonuclease HI